MVGLDVLEALSTETLARGAAGYEQARCNSIWSERKPDRYPDLIVRPRAVGEAAAIVKEARRRNWTVACRGTGHNFWGSFLRDGGVLLDMSALRAVRVQGQSVHTQPGVTSADLAEALAANGRAFPTGHEAGVGIGGFLLGGGMGWNGEHWGQFACFNIEAVDVVLADGQTLTISETVEPELFWAARGGGMFFPAIVTGFHLKTAQHPGSIAVCHYVYPLDQIEPLADWLAQIGEIGHPGLECFLAIESGAAPDPSRPCGVAAQCRVYLLAYQTPAGAAEALLASVMAGAPKGCTGPDFAVLSRFPELYAGGIIGGRRRTANDTAWTHDGAQAVATLGRHMATAPSSGCMAIVNFRAAPRLDPDAPMMAAKTFITLAAQWETASEDAINLDWLDRTVRALEPYTTACYLNETDLERRPERLPICFAPSAIARLRAVRERYDPDNRLPPPRTL